MVNSPRHDSRRRGDQGHRSRGDGRGRQRHQEPDPTEMSDLCRRVVLIPMESGSLDSDLFDVIAEKAAKIVAKEKTKNSQLRRFYDELWRWDERVNSGDPEGAETRLREHLPFIRMMNAKAAYAKGRGGNLVGGSFVVLLRSCLAQVSGDPAALRNCRLFFEAFMGFYKLHGPRD